MPETILLFLSPAAAVLLLLFYINLRLASPVLAIPIRWLRWILFAIFAAQANDQLAFNSAIWPCGRWRISKSRLCASSGK